MFQPALGYTRVKFAGRNMLTKCLIDSGNLFHDLISYELATKLQLKITKINKNIGTASNKASMHNARPDEA